MSHTAAVRSVRRAVQAAGAWPAGAGKAGAGYAQGEPMAEVVQECAAHPAFPHWAPPVGYKVVDRCAGTVWRGTFNEHEARTLRLAEGVAAALEAGGARRERALRAARG